MTVTPKPTNRSHPHKNQWEREFTQRVINTALLNSEGFREITFSDIVVVFLSGIYSFIPLHSLESINHLNQSWNL